MACIQKVINMRLCVDILGVLLEAGETTLASRLGLDSAAFQRLRAGKLSRSELLSIAAALQIPQEIACALCLSAPLHSV